jgi:hypothetical protein
MQKALLKNRRCFNHAEREASARCPECQNDFCRECITEHAGRMLCVNCLKKLSKKKKSEKKMLTPFFYAILFITSLLFIFLCFVWFGRTISDREVSDHSTHNSQSF